MTDRERLLSYVVGALVAIMIAFWGYSRISRSFSQRDSVRRQLQGQLDQKREVLEAARSVSKRLEAYEKMSLPSNVEIARSQYQAWLSELLASTNLVDPQVKVASQARRSDGSTVLTCTISGKGNLEQFAILLHQFYSVHTIHRIRIMPIKPIAESKNLDINMTIDAMILATAPRNQDFDTSALSPMAALDRDQVIGPIVQRNKFSRANNPPEMATVGDQEIELGKALTVSFSARDADAVDKLNYTLIDGPEGVRLEKESGSVYWMPTEVGDYELAVRVADDGIPRKTVDQRILVRVVESPPVSEATGLAGQQLKFDDAKYTYAIASLETNDGRQVWLQVRTRGTILKLGVGDEVKIGSIVATVSSIRDREFELDLDGERKLVKLGQPLINPDRTSVGE